MPQEETQRKRRRHRQKRVDRTPPPESYLPPLALDKPDEETVQVQVLPRPRFANRNVWTWTMKERPAGEIGVGTHVTLATGGQASGVGRLSAVADLKRHWATYIISGSPMQCRLRAPVAWVTLSGLEAYTHRALYLQLSPIPGPHESLAALPHFQNELHNPYYEAEEEREDKRETERLRERIARITNAD